MREPMQPSAIAELSELDRRLLNDYQHGLPLSPTPYADIAKSLGVDEKEVIKRLRQLQDSGAVSRVGAVFRPKRLGASTLATMAVPQERLEAVAELVNGYEQVNHNYERDHYFNLWFVVTAENELALQSVLDDIEQRSQLRVLSLPMIEAYHIDLGFDIHFQDQAGVGG